MSIKYKIHTVSTFFLHAFFLMFFLNTTGQEIRVIDNKGTIETVRNTNVTTSAAAPATPLENDIWFDTGATPNEIKVYDGATWLTIDGHRGTQGSVFFAGTSDGAPTEDNANFFWDDTNDRLGIGTASPDGPLHVQGNIGTGLLILEGTEPDIIINDTSGAGFTTINFQRNGVDNTLLGLNDDDNFYIGAFFSGGFFNNAFTVNNATRNVGINVAEANSRLQVEGAVSKSIFRTTAAFALTNNHYSIIITDASHNIVLPTADATNEGREHVIKNPNNTAVTISSYLDNTESVSTSIPANSVLKIQSDGSSWNQMNNTGGSGGNTVTRTSTPATSTPATYTFAETPQEDDVFIYEFASGNHSNIYTYDGAAWVQIAPTKASRIFYPPSIPIDASTVSANLAAPGDESQNLYSFYTSQFGLLDPTTSASSGGGAIPTYNADELDYYVTYYDNTIFSNVAISAMGVLTYDIILSPADDNTIINVVFVVK